MVEQSLTLRAALRAGCGTLAIAMLAAPGMAQTAAPPTPVAQPAPAATDNAAVNETAADETIVVTGSILRRSDVAAASPITVLDTQDLDRRAVTTVQEGIQQLTSNNGPALTNSFTANGAFGAGASAVSLRGLTTSSTLVLFDGLRAAYYPLSDDGARNFVDLNTIPDDIVDRVEVLRDGASANYGADAIAGVVNIITKRSFEGVAGRAEAGLTERGDAANERLSLTLGVGNLRDQGFNAYVSGFYVRSDQLKNNTRRYPYNSSDQRALCFEGTCGPNNVINGLDASGAYPGGFGGGTSVNASTLFVRPYDATNTTAQGRYQILNPGAGCRNGPTYIPTAAELANPANAALATTVCQEDVVERYGVITPNIERFGGTLRASARIGDDSEAYVTANFQQSTVGYDGLPATIRANANAGILFPRYTNSSGANILTLPVFVCASGVNCATAADRRLNPNNPFAAQGQVARLIGRLDNLREFNQTRSRVYRAAAGIGGTLFGDLDYNLDATAMHNDLRRISRGYVYIANLNTAVATGSYNFIDPSQNTQAQNDFLSPDNVNDSSSDLYQAQLTLGKALFELPGGPLQLGLGAAIRYEAVDAPSGNDDYAGPTQRYFRLNAFGTSGNRTVYSAFAELNAPIVEAIEVNVAGRYDKYSSGQSAFSPKATVRFKPIDQVILRGTYSRGFRIPSFAEANALPTTGFVTQSVSNIPQSFLGQYGPNCNQANAAGCPSYITGYSVGLTSLGTPGLRPEKSRSFTAGVVFEPLRNVRLTVDYYNIKKTDAITSADPQPAIDAYYARGAIPAGFNVIPDAVDPNFTSALPRIAFVEAGFINANTIKSEGLDFGATAQFDFGNDISFTSSAEASYILELSTTFPDGTTQQYAGTLGNFNLTAGSGTPKWRGSWQNTIDFNTFALTASANYFGGYNLSAEDQGGVSGDCGLSPGNVPCDVSSYLTVDVTGTFKVNDQFNFYINVLNVADRMPPIDPVTYGANNYNPVQGGTGILGRAYRAGVRFNF